MKLSAPSELLIHIQKQVIRYLDKKPCASRVPTVSFDFDGTLADVGFLSEAWDPQVCRNFKGGFTCADCNALGERGKFLPCSGLRSREGVEARVQALAHPGFWELLPAHDQADIESVSEAVETGRCAAIFIASRPDTGLDESPMFSDARTQTVNWLAAHGITRQVQVSTDSKDKVVDLVLAGVDYHVGDDPFEVRRLREAGIEAYLVTRPWNKYVPCPYRIDSVADFLSKVLPAVSQDIEISAVA